MVLRMLEGFETKRANATKLSSIYTMVGTPTYTGGRKVGFGAQSIDVTLTSGELVSPDENTWIVGFAIRKTTATAYGASATVGIQLQNDGGEQCSLIVVAEDANYKMRLKRGSTTIDTTTGAFPWGSTQSWMYFQLKVTVRDGVDGVYELKSYDYTNTETVEFSGSGVNLAEQATDGADRIRISWDADSGANTIIDDIIVMDSTGAFNNDFMSEPTVIFGALPSSEGNQLDWLPSLGGQHWVEVGNAATTTSDTDQVTAQVVGDIDLWNYQNFSLLNAAGTAVIGVQVITTAAMVASGTRTLRVRVRESASEATGDNFVLTDLILASYRQMFDQNPTGAPATWTKTTVEAAEFGIEIQA